MPKAVALALCGFGTVLIVLGLRLSRAGRATLGFTRTQGAVLVSRVDELPGPIEQGGTRFAPVIRYGFEARGRRYESEHVFVEWTPSTPDAQEARSLVERHPAGSAVDVWYDPADPRRSVLVRGADSTRVTVAVVVGLGLLAMGLFALAR